MFQYGFVTDSVMMTQHFSILALKVAQRNRTREGPRTGDLGRQLVVEVAVGEVPQERLAVQEGGLADRADDRAGRLLSLETGCGRFDTI